MRYRTDSGPPGKHSAPVSAQVQATAFIAPTARAERSQGRWFDLDPAPGLHPLHQIRLDALTCRTRNLARGEALYRCGDPLEWLFEVHSGMFKTHIASADGRVQVAGFQLSGEWIGLDGIDTGRHAVEAVALEYAQVYAIHYAGLCRLLQEVAALQRQFHRILGREIVRNQALMMLLGGMCAGPRVATFLLDMMQRLQARGYSSTSLVLRMTRDEIGSYLGLTLETVSRVFSRLACDGVLEVKSRQVGLLDVPALRRLARGAEGV